jgi:hypothetical protein
MSFTQLASPIPVSIVDKGNGMAFAVIDYGPDRDLTWVSALEDSGEICCAPNPKVRLRSEWARGRLPGTRNEQAAPSVSSITARSIPAPAVGSWTTANSGQRPLRAVHIPEADAEHSAFP